MAKETSVGRGLELGGWIVSSIGMLVFGFTLAVKRPPDSSAELLAFLIPGFVLHVPLVLTVLLHQVNWFGARGLVRRLHVFFVGWALSVATFSLVARLEWPFVGYLASLVVPLVVFVVYETAKARHFWCAACGDAFSIGEVRAANGTCKACASREFTYYFGRSAWGMTYSATRSYSGAELVARAAHTGDGNLRASIDTEIMQTTHFVRR